METATLRLEVDDLFTAYVECLDDGEFERWPDFFTDDCLYKIIPRENFERDLPLALMRCESKRMLHDRITAIRRTSVYVPRVMRHLLSTVRVKRQDDAVVDVQASFALFETPLNEATRLFAAGKYIDQIVREDGQLKFKQKLCVLDASLVLGSLIFPI